MGRSDVQLPRRLRRKASLAAPKRPARRRFLPQNVWVRGLLIAAIVVGYAALMWYIVFPWVDRTFVNRPAL